MKNHKTGGSMALAMVGGLLFMAGVFAPAGCGRKNADDQVIRVARNIGGREGFRLHWTAWKKAFETGNPGWTMELIDLGNASGAEFYKSRIATGDLPDVVQLWNLTSFLADGGHLHPLPDSFYEKFGIELPLPYKGKRYASMSGLQIEGIAVNSRMWRDVGITEPPKTWDEFMDGLRKLKAKGYRPLNYGGREWSASMPLNYSVQINMYDRTPDPAKPSWTTLRDRKTVTFATDPTARKILENMIALIETFAEKGTAGDGYNEEQRRFYGGEAATWIMGCWIGGDLEGNKVDMDIDFWPLPPMVGDRDPAFIANASMQNGWGITTSAKGAKFEKAMAVIESLYAPEVYQLFLNGEGQFAMAKRVAVTGPKSTWEPAQKFYDKMAARLAQFGWTTGARISLDDAHPPLIDSTMARVMQEILAGNRDVDKLLKMLDDDWDSARKGM